MGQRKAQAAFITKRITQPGLKSFESGHEGIQQTAGCSLGLVGGASSGAPGG